MVEPKDPTAPFYDYPDDFRVTAVGATWKVMGGGAAILALISAPWHLVSDLLGKRKREFGDVCGKLSALGVQMIGTN